jgi:hypothetical protein
VRDPVALLLADHDVAGQFRPVREVREHLVEQVGAAHDVRRRLLEQVEELAVLGGEDVRQAGHGLRECSCESGVNGDVPAQWAGTSGRSSRVR